MAAPRRVAGVPGVLTIAGRDFPVPASTPHDQGVVYEEMRRLAALGCTNPITAVAALPLDALSGADRAEALRAAVAIVGGGGAEPTREAVVRQYDTLDGLRFQVHHYARQLDPAVTREQVAAAVTADARFDVADALLVAVGLKALDPNGVSPAGASGSPASPGPN